MEASLENKIEELPTEQVVLSKNQKKRIIREEYLLAKKKQKKIAEKERRRASRSHAVRESHPNTIAADYSDESRQEKKDRLRSEFMAKCASNFAVIIDCDFECHHAERPIKSLSQQIAFCHGFNKKAPNPANIFLTGVGSKLSTQLAKSHVEGWTGVSIESDCYSAFWSSDEKTADGAKFPASPTQRLVNKESLIYLTSDAEETLYTLDNKCVYVIGGIVDRNRLKGITHAKATAQGIRTAKLPIKEFVSMASTPVLTINHVFEILLLFQQSQSWADTLQQVLPSRKEIKLAAGKALAGGLEAGEKLGADEGEDEGVEDDEEVDDDEGDESVDGDVGDKDLDARSQEINK